jgi:hypothetical protein
MKAIKLVLATIVLIATISMSIFPFACTADWTTVRTVTGSAGQTSKTFSITAQEWRIEWSFTPDPRFPSLAFFGVLVYPEGEDVSYVYSFYVNGSTPTNGIENITGGMSNYHLEILAANVPSYTIDVQQYGGTISNGSDGNFDFGNLTNVVLVVFVVAIFVVVAVVVLLKRRINRRSRELSLSPTSASMMLYI